VHLFIFFTMRQSLALLSFVALATAYPQRGGKGRAKATAQQQAAQVPQGLSTATDGSTILDNTVMVKYVPSISFTKSLTSLKHYQTSC
jgi:hypothetical protein